MLTNSGNDLLGHRKSISFGYVAAEFYLPFFFVVVLLATSAVCLAGFIQTIFLNAAVSILIL